tara:strand:+ start:14117 stop:14236 length:120 start_codon:yes stop_codon:yes gene_type:complete
MGIVWLVFVKPVLLHVWGIVVLMVVVGLVEVASRDLPVR